LKKLIEILDICDEMNNGVEMRLGIKNLKSLLKSICPDHLCISETGFHWNEMRKIWEAV
jgi:hypothetical protein